MPAPFLMTTKGKGAPKVEKGKADPAKLIKGKYLTQTWNHWTGEDDRLLPFGEGGEVERLPVGGGGGERRGEAVDAGFIRRHRARGFRRRFGGEGGRGEQPERDRQSGFREHSVWAFGEYGTAGVPGNTPPGTHITPRRAVGFHLTRLTPPSVRRGEPRPRRSSSKRP